LNSGFAGGTKIGVETGAVEGLAFGVELVITA
jgi:hypothetical protein